MAEAVWVTHSAGVGRAMAEWLVDGYCSSFDLHECDVNRFEPHQLSPEYVLAKDCQNYVEVYDILHPLEPMLKPRPMRTSPFYPRQVELGAYFLEASGWERPQWYEANAGLLERYPVERPNDWAARHWSPIVGAEARATRDGVALYDMTALKRLEVTGPGATAFLQWLTTGNVDKSVGSVTYCLLLDVDGGIRSDITVARLGPNRYQVGVNGNLDLDWFTRHLPDDGSVTVRDITAGTCCVGVWGPRARDVVQALTVDDFSNEALRYFRATTTHVGTVAGDRAAAVLCGRTRLGALHHGGLRARAVGHAVGGRPGARDHRGRAGRVQLAAAGEGVPLVRRRHDLRARPVRGRARLRREARQGRLPRPGRRWSSARARRRRASSPASPSTTRRPS